MKTALPLVLTLTFAVALAACNEKQDGSAPSSSPELATTAKADVRASNKSNTPAEDASDEAYARFARMYQDRHLEALENELYERHVSALKIIPALGGKTNVADILKSRKIRIGPNPDVTCLPMVKLANAPGCILTVYLTRRHPDRQTDLSGVPAHWFMPINGTKFRPLAGWAQHVDQNDQWLDTGGAFGNADNR